MKQDEAKQVEEEIGFDVILIEPTSRTSLHQRYALLNLSRAMVGMHRAALNTLVVSPAGLSVHASDAARD